MIASLLEKTTFAVILAVDNPNTYIGFVAMIFPYLYLTSSVRRASCAMFSLRWMGDENLSQCKCAGYPQLELRLTLSFAGYPISFKYLLG